MFYKSPHNFDPKENSDRCSTAPGGPSLTIQSQSEDADINVMMARFGITGKFPENPRLPSFGDFTGISDFRSALHAIAHAQEIFNEYPAAFRARFENNPQNFLTFVSDPANLSEMQTLGLLKEKNGNTSVASGTSGESGVRSNGNNPNPPENNSSGKGTASGGSGA